MFHPGDIVALKEPDIGEEAVAICRDATMRRTLSDSKEQPVIFVCYTKLYDNELDCVLIERYGMEKNSTFRYYIGYSDDYELSPNTEFYTKDEMGFAKMLTSLKCDITCGNTTYHNECAVLASSDTFDRILCMMSEMIEKIHNPHELQFVINFAFEALAPYSTQFDKVVIYQ